MADRRMIHRKVVESDSFYKLSEGAQSIYTHLTINADEDGFVNNAQSITARFKAGPKKLAELVSKRFVLKIGDVYVIKHWRIGNSLKNDRTKPPTYPSVAAAIWVKPNRAYTDHPVDGCKTLLEFKTGIQLESKRNPDGIQPESQKKGTEEEGNRNEGKGNEAASGEWFEIIWNEYPEHRRGSKEGAESDFSFQVRTAEDFELATRSLAAWKLTTQWTENYGQFVPSLRNWLSNGIWRNVPQVAHQSRELDADELAAIQRMLREG